jgi:hypothetical protein
MAFDQLPLPEKLFNALLESAAAAQKHRVSYALIGAVASGFRSRPRFTQDLDLLIDVPELVLPALLEDLRDRGFSFEMEPTIREWIQDHLTVLYYQGVRVDWLKPVLPCYRHVLDEAVTESWLGNQVRIATAEGMILMKLLASRSQDLLDIENMLAGNRGKLDLDKIRREWETVADTADPRYQRYLELVKRFYQGPAM